MKPYLLFFLSFPKGIRCRRCSQPKFTDQRHKRISCPNSGTDFRNKQARVFSRSANGPETYPLWDTAKQQAGGPALLLSFCPNRKTGCPILDAHLAARVGYHRCRAAHIQNRVPGVPQVSLLRPGFPQYRTQNLAQNYPSNAQTEEVQLSHPVHASQSKKQNTLKPRQNHPKTAFWSTQTIPQLT